MGQPNILILSAQVPFTRGGAEILIDGLQRELRLRGFNADIVSLPFNAQPKSALLRQVALWRAVEFDAFAGRRVDLVIGTKFPTYVAVHPNKVTWLIHQHRQLYELYGTRFGDFDVSPEDESLREMLLEADRKALEECGLRCTISENVTRRLKRYLGLDSQALAPPLPLGNAYRSDDPEEYILSVGRLCSIKRVDLLIKALPRIEEKLKVKIVGLPDEPAIDSYLRSEIEKHHLWHRVEFLGRVEDDTLVKLFAEAFAVYYAPFDEDYGFVTLEALQSGRPVVTAKDSGTVLEFVRNRENGLVVEPNEKAVAEAFNCMFNDSELYSRLRSGAQSKIRTRTWDEIVDRLTSTL